MQRTNSGSLFPTSFYFGNRAARATSKEVQGVDGEKELEPSPQEQERKERAEMLKCRSYPESEFRDITRINEENVQDLDAERSPLMRSPSGSMSSSSTRTYVDPEESLLASVLGSFDQGLSYTSSIENEKIKRRSQSEDNLSTAVKTSSFNDEVAPQLKSQKNPSEDGRQEFRDELATLMTMPKNVVTYEASGTTEEAKPRNGILRNRESSPKAPRKRHESSPKAPRKIHESSTKAPEEEATADWKKSSKDNYNSNKISEDVRPFLTYGDEYATTLTFPNKQQEQQQQYQQQYHQQQPDQPTETTSYRNDQRTPQFNNNYKQVSDILDSKKPRTTNTKYSLKVEQPPERNFADSVPVRPPRKKDMISKNFAKSQENHDDQSNDDFDSLSEFLGDEHAAMLLSSPRRYSEPDSVDKTVLGNSENRRTSENKHNENMNERHSQDFSKSNSEVPRRRSEGYVKVKEMSLDHPRRRTDNNFPNEPEAVRVESGNKRVLPDVLLDTSVARPGSDGHNSGMSRGGSAAPAQEAVGDRSRDEPRVLPPYRPPLNRGVDPTVRRSRELPPSSENTTSNTRPPSRPSYPPPSIPPPSFQRSQEPGNYNRSREEPGNYNPSREEPDNYNRSREVSLDHPRRRSMNYVSTDAAGPITSDPRRKSDGTDFMRYSAHDASLDESGLSTRQWTGENSTTRSATSAGDVVKNREPRNYSYPVDNISNDKRVSRDQTETRSSSDAGNYRNMYDVSKRNGLPRQSSVDYEQEMATVLVPRSDRDSGVKTKVSYDGEPGYIVARQVPSDDGNEAANQSESNDDLDLLSSFLGEDMTSKWFSDTSSNAMTSEAEQSVNAMTSEAEQKQMYRFTSMT